MLSLIFQLISYIHLFRIALCCSRRNAIVLRTQLSVRVQACIGALCFVLLFIDFLSANIYPTDCAGARVHSTSCVDPHFSNREADARDGQRAEARALLAEAALPGRQGPRARVRVDAHLLDGGGRVEPAAGHQQHHRSRLPPEARRRRQRSQLPDLRSSRYCTVLYTVQCILVRSGRSCQMIQTLELQTIGVVECNGGVSFIACCVRH